MDLIPGVAHATSTIIVGYPFDIIKCVVAQPSFLSMLLCSNCRSHIHACARARLQD